LVFAWSYEKQIPLCVPRPPECDGKEKARDCVRDDTACLAEQHDGDVPETAASGPEAPSLRTW